MKEFRFILVREDKTGNKERMGAFKEQHRAERAAEAFRHGDASGTYSVVTKKVEAPRG